LFQDRKKTFNRRLYPGLHDLLNDVGYIFSKRKLVKPLMRGELIDPAFRERIMVAVSAVNGCRYCSYVHTRAALAQGISQEEVKALNRSDPAFEDCPEEQIIALCYAQHWAESGCQPDPAARGAFVQSYNPETLEAVDLTMRVIHLANMAGNTLDYILYKMSFGKYKYDRQLNIESAGH